MLKLFILVCFAVNGLVDSIPIDEPVIEGHIVGGNETDIRELPYQVAVYAMESHVCGGFILTPSHIVTSAQCLHSLDPGAFKIRAGSSSIKMGGVTKDVKGYRTHPKYNSRSADYDVSVLELVAPLKLNNETMKAIKLATKEPTTGSPALVSGYGATDTTGGRLHSAMLPMYDRTKCQTFFEPYEITITPRMTCAGGNKKFTDLEDGGGALVYNNEAVGIVSFRYGFGDKRRPIVFTNMVDPEISKFIKEAGKL